MSKPDVNQKNVVLVCVENSNRSQMAEAFARIHGGEQVTPFSAGSLLRWCGRAVTQRFLRPFRRCLVFLSDGET